MKILCKNKWRISAITKENGEYHFFSNGVRVSRVVCHDIESWIPSIPANALPWQYPVLSVEIEENGSYYQQKLDGRIIHSERGVNRSPLKKFVNHYPENPNLEEEINQLPILYRVGLKVLLYTKLKKTEDKRYMSMLLWLNKGAANVYKRYNSVHLSYPAISPNEDWQEIKANLETVLKAQANLKPKFMTVEDYLEQLGIRKLEDLTKDEIEVVTELVCYMIKVNTSIAEDQNQIWKKMKRSREMSESEEREAYLNMGTAKSWKNQDLLSLGEVKEEELADFLNMYQI